MMRFRVVFEYVDSWSKWEWRRQECSVFANRPHEAKQKCIALYGLGIDCNYKFISVEVEKDEI